MKWKIIANYPNYQVSDHGDIMSLRTNKLLRHNIDKDGYHTVMLYNAGTCKRHKVHRLVAQAFISGDITGREINHKDEDPSNNNFENLEVCTTAYNINYGTRNYKVSEKLKANPPRAQKPVEGVDDDGIVVVSFPSLHAAERAGYNRSAIYQICSHYEKSRLKTYCGLKWRYA